MPQRRTYRRRNKARRQWKRKGAQVGNMAYTAYKLASKVARIVNSEVKFHDAQQTQTNIDTNGNVHSLCTIAQGDGDNSRDGSSIKLAHLTIRGTLQGNANETSPTRVRIILLRGKGERGTTPTFATTLEDITNFDAIVSPKSWNNKFNSKILYDKVFMLYPYNVGNNGSTKYFKINMKLYGHVKWETANTDGTDIEDGGLYLMMISDEGTNMPNTTYYSRLTYYDN